MIVGALKTEKANFSNSDIPTVLTYNPDRQTEKSLRYALKAGNLIDSVGESRAVDLPVCSEDAGNILTSQIIFARHTETDIFGGDDFITVLNHDIIAVYSSSVVGCVANCPIKRH